MDKKYLSNVCLYFVTGVVAVFLILFVLYHLAGSDNAYPTAVALHTDADRTLEGDGYIFRKETVLTTSHNGALYSPYSPGANVEAGAQIAFFYQDSRLTEELSECDATVATLTESRKTADLSVINAKIKELTAEVRRLSTDGNAEGLINHLQELQIQLNKRKTATGAAEGIDKEIEQIKTRKAALSEQLGAPLYTLNAPVSGNYYTACDGYEEIFSSDKISGLTVSSFLDLTECQPKLPEDGQTCAGKIRQSSYWYLSLVTDSANAVSMTAGKSYTVYAGANEEKLTMTLEKMSVDTEKGLTLLVFGSRICPSSDLGRCEQVRVVTETDRGLMVPTAAARYKKTEDGNETVGVYVKEGNKILFKKISILTEHHGYYVVKEFSASDEEYRQYLCLNDVVITSGKGLKEGYVD